MAGLASRSHYGPPFSICESNQFLISLRQFAAIKNFNLLSKSAAKKSPLPTLFFNHRVFQMTSKIAIVVRLFAFIFVVCFVLMFLFASLPVIAVTALILTAMQGLNFLFVQVGMNVIYKNDDGYKQAKRLGYDPFFDSLPTSINPQANRTCYVLPHPEPQYSDFKPPPYWAFQCLSCYGRVPQSIGQCWRCEARLD